MQHIRMSISTFAAALLIAGCGGGGTLDGMWTPVEGRMLIVVIDDQWICQCGQAQDGSMVTEVDPVASKSGDIEVGDDGTTYVYDTQTNEISATNASWAESHVYDRPGPDLINRLQAIGCNFHAGRCPGPSAP